MMDKQTPHEPEEPPDLLVPPHLLPQVFDLLIGEWQPDAEQQEHLEQHLLTCSFCRVALIYLLSVAEEADRQSSAPDSPTPLLRERWIALHRRLE